MKIQYYKWHATNQKTPYIKLKIDKKNRKLIVYGYSKDCTEGWKFNWPIGKEMVSFYNDEYNHNTDNLTVAEEDYFNQFE